ncbi:MAG: hypothetical protein RI924_15 [Bacteroidota bacterium]|jgi:23S rRNA pseudouridine2605 synthase
MPTPRQRNRRDDKSSSERAPKKSFSDRKSGFKPKSTESFRPNRDTDKKSFEKKPERSFKTGKKDAGDYKPRKSFDKEGSAESPKKFDRSSKRPFETSDKRSFRKDGDSAKRSFRKEGDSEKRPFRKDGDSAKRSFRKDEDSAKRTFRKEGDTDERSDFTKSYKRSDGPHERGYQKTYKARKSAPERLGGKGPKRPTASAKDDGLIRLNRYISNAGICSRRKADELIAAGVVSVNGTVVSELGFRVDPAKDVIRYNGETLKREKMVYVLLNKPKDYITTTDDPQERRTVMQLVEKASRERIYPVGRLDRNTTGLLLMTNDGDLAEKLSHPKNNVTKIYHAELNKSLSQGDLNKISFGLELEDGFIKPDEITYVQGASKREIGIQIHSGKNRIVRRIFEHLGYEVIKLDRVIYANLTKKDLPRGRWRHLDEKEIIQLKHLIK